MLYSGNDFLWSFFPQYEGKAMIDVNPGGYFLFSSNPQMSKSFDQMQGQLINKFHVHLTLVPKNRFSWYYFPKYPIYSQVSWKYSPVHVSNSCLRIKSRMPWPFPPFLAPTTSHSTTVLTYNISWRKLSGWYFNTYLEATLKYFWMK